MWRKRAERFETSLQRAARGEKAEEPYRLLVETAHAVSAIEVPPPPRGLVLGRQRLTAEAARLRPERATNRRLPVFAGRRMQLVPILVSLLILLALLPAFAQEVAASLPGSPLYGLKVLAQDVHLWMTSSPATHADLDLSVAECRLNDVAAALEQGHAINEATADSTEKQLGRAVETFAHNPDTAGTAVQLQFMSAIQNCERIMSQALNRMSESDQRHLRELLRQMERARQELHTGAGEATGEQERARQGGDPPAPQEMPGGLGRTDPWWRWVESQSQGPADPGAGETGQPAPEPKHQQEAAGPAQAAETPPAATPTPEQPQQYNGEQQQEPGGNDPHGNSSPGNQGNNGHSGHP